MRSMFRLASVLMAVVFFSMTSGAQDRLLHGQVIDAGTGLSMQGAHVVLIGHAGGTVSDSSGRFAIAVDPSRMMKVHISHIGYVDVDRTVGPYTDDPLIVRMDRASIAIPEVLIRRRGPELVYQRQDLHVGDHYPSADGIWVLVYDKPQLWHREGNAGEQLFREASLHLLESTFSERASCVLPSRVRRLHRDHQGRVIVEGEYGAWVASIGRNGIDLHPIDRSVLHNAVLPWTDSIPGFLLGNTCIPTYPAFEHIAYDPLAREQFAICSVEDKHTMQLFRSQYKYMSGREKVIAMDLEIETGIDREVIAGYMTGFHDDPYFHLPYAPLFVVDGALCVFDHAKERILRFGQDRVLHKEVMMTHQNERGWEGRLIQDQVNGAIYALYSRGMNSWLRRVNAENGAVGSAVRITHPFPEVVRVFDDQVYYVYRPYGSLQHRTLYREPLR